MRKLKSSLLLIVCVICLFGCKKEKVEERAPAEVASKVSVIQPGGNPFGVNQLLELEQIGPYTWRTTSTWYSSILTFNNLLMRHGYLTGQLMSASSSYDSNYVHPIIHGNETDAEVYHRTFAYAEYSCGMVTSRVSLNTSNESAYINLSPGTSTFYNVNNQRVTNTRFYTYGNGSYTIDMGEKSSSTAGKMIRISYNTVCSSQMVNTVGKLVAKKDANGVVKYYVGDINYQEDPIFPPLTEE